MVMAAPTASGLGILLFASQALDGLLALKEFVEVVKYGPKERAALLSDIQALQRVINSSTDLISKCVDNTESLLVKALAQLGDSIEACSREISKWQQEDIFKKDSPKSWKVLTQKLSHAANKDVWQKLSSRVSVQREKIALDLALLGR